MSFRTDNQSAAERGSEASHICPSGSAKPPIMTHVPPAGYASLDREKADLGTLLRDPRYRIENQRSLDRSRCHLQVRGLDRSLLACGQPIAVRGIWINDEGHRIDVLLFLFAEQSA